jgi:hypothetical protein
MPLNTIRRELRGYFIYFIPAGTVVDGGTVSKTAWPDGVPTTNYTDWQFADIEKAVLELLQDSETFSVPSTSGGYEEDEEKWIKGRKWKCTSPATNSLLKQLENGTASPIAVGVSQKPLGTRVCTIDGVLLIEIKSKDGAVIERTQVWARLSIITPAGGDKTTSKIEFEFKQLESSLNTFLLVA